MAGKTAVPPAPTGGGGGGLGFGYGTSSSKSTGRTGQEIRFPKQFLSDFHDYLGGPFTTSDLMRMMPRPQSMFGFAPQQQWGPQGQFNLGFGPPTAPPEGTGGSLGGGTPGDLGGGGMQPGDTTGQPPETPAKTYGLNDLMNSYFKDPEKRMDLQRLYRQAGLDIKGATFEDLSDAVNNAKKYGFSGRSIGNFTQMLADLQSDQSLEGSFGGSGGKGTGVF